MTVTQITKDAGSLTMSVHAQFDAPVEQVWGVWADARKLERWWGPPTYPATVLEHELTPGGRVTYSMTGPDGDQPRGWWRVLSVEAPHHLEFEDGFADEAGEPNPELPTMIVRVAITALDSGGTSMVVETRFPTLEAMEQLLAMGMEEGIRLAAGQIDELLD